MELVRLPKQRAIDAVYQALRDAILTRSFEPGERLQVESLSRKLGVGPAQIRVAFQQLSAEGLVEIHPRSGTFVGSQPIPDAGKSAEVDLVDRALSILGTPQRLASWMQSSIPALHGQTPYSLLQSAAGRQQVETVLGRIEHGIY